MKAALFVIPFAALAVSCADTSLDTYCDDHPLVCDTRVTAISPSVGPITGGTLVTIHGQAFEPGTRFFLGNEQMSAVTLVDSRTATAVTPPGDALASYKIRAVNLNGDESFDVLFRYVTPSAVASISPRHGPKQGLTELTVRGANFHPGTRVFLDDIEISPVAVSADGTELKLRTPPRSTADLVSVRVSGPGGEITLPGGYQYVAWNRMTFAGMNEGAGFSRAVRSGTTVYVAAPQDLYRSMDDGASWAAVSLPAPASPPHTPELAVGATASTVYLATGTLYRSTDSGMTWRTPLPPGSTQPIFATAVTVNPTDATVYAGAAGRFFRSTDEGLTFVQVSVLPQNLVFHSLRTHPADTNVVFGIGSAQGQGMLYLLSNDRGQTWTTQSIGDASAFHAVAEPGPAAGEVWVGAEGILQQSFNYGASFTQIGLVYPGGTGLRALAALGTRIYVATSSSLFVLDTAAPEPSWESILNTGAEALLTDSSERLLAVGRLGIFRNDGFGGWSAQMTGMTTPNVTAFAQDAANTPPTLYAATLLGSVLRSTDRGLTWERLLPPSQGSISALAVVPGGPVLVVANNRVYSQSETGTWLEEHWLDAGIPVSLHVNRLTTLSTDPDATYASGSGRLYQRAANGVWVEEPNLPTDGTLTETSAPHLAGHTAFAVHSSVLGTLQLYLDEPGTPWRAVGPFLETGGNAVVEVAVAQDVLLVSANNVLQRLHLGTLTWSTPTSTVGYTGCLRVDPVQRSTVYSVSNTVQKSNDAGNTWRSLPLGPQGVHASQGIVDAHEPRHLFVTAQEGGAYVSTTAGE